VVQTEACCSVVKNGRYERIIDCPSRVRKKSLDQTRKDKNAAT
jgi:hypothetical protein